MELIALPYVVQVSNGGGWKDDAAFSSETAARFYRREVSGVTSMPVRLIVRGEDHRVIVDAQGRDA